MKTATKFFHTLPLLFFCASAFFGTFSSCTAEEDEYKIYTTKAGRFDINENEYVTLQILPEEGTDHASAWYILGNYTERRLLGGVDFSMEYFNKNNWESVSMDAAFYKIGLNLAAGNTVERREEDLFRIIKKYNKGKKGNYKYTQRFGLEGNCPLGDEGIAFSLSAEFEIK